MLRKVKVIDKLLSPEWAKVGLYSSLPVFQSSSRVDDDQVMMAGMMASTNKLVVASFLFLFSFSPKEELTSQEPRGRGGQE